MDTLRWTVDDVELLPDDGSRYEIIDGELYVSKQPDMHHQLVGTRIASFLDLWSLQSQRGYVVSTPGIIFANDNAVVQM